MLKYLSVTLLSTTLLFSHHDDDSSMMEAIPPGRYDYMDGGGFDFMAAYTFWAARQDGLAISYDTSPQNNQMMMMNEDDVTVKYPMIDPRSGFKLGAGYIFSHDGWDLAFAYTWFYNKDNTYTPATAPTASNAMNTIYATWDIPNEDDNKFVADMMGSAWNIAFNRIDLTLGRSFYAGHYLSLRPFLGMVFAWDDQDFWVSYGYMSGSDMNSDDTNMGMVTEWRNCQDWYGIGPYLGLSPSFIFWISEDHDNTLSICGSSGMALTYSRANTKMRQFDGAMTPNESTTATAEYRDIFTYVTPLLEACLGICWDGTYGGGWSARAAISWEQQSWFSHNRMFSIGNYPSSRGIFSMQGLTITFGLGF